MSALDAALTVWQDINIQQLRKKYLALAQLFITLVDEQACLKELTLCSPTNDKDRGSHIAYSHDNAYAICQALIDRGIITDFRAPNILRIGFTPLYTSYEDIWRSVQTLTAIVKDKVFLALKYGVKTKVT